MTNKQLKGIVAAMAALLAVNIIVSISILKGYESETKALAAVDSYIDKTADTGEMDEFLSSVEGSEFCKYYYGK